MRAKTVDNILQTIYSDNPERVNEAWSAIKFDPNFFSNMKHLEGIKKTEIKSRTGNLEVISPHSYLWHKQVTSSEDDVISGFKLYTQLLLGYLPRMKYPSICN